MNLLESLLDAIVRLEGDALVMHVGEKPYVVTTSAAMSEHRGPLAWGQVELSSRVLTPEAVLGMLGQILPLDQRQALEDLGAIDYEIAGNAGSSDRFTVIAARGGDDVWLEVRRNRAQPASAAPQATPGVVEEVHADAPVAETPAAHVEMAAEPVAAEAPVAEPEPAIEEPVSAAVVETDTTEVTAVAPAAESLTADEAVEPADSVEVPLVAEATIESVAVHAVEEPVAAEEAPQGAESLVAPAAIEPEPVQEPAPVEVEPVAAAEAVPLEEQPVAAVEPAVEAEAPIAEPVFVATPEPAVELTQAEPPVAEASPIAAPEPIGASAEAAQVPVEAEPVAETPEPEAIYAEAEPIGAAEPEPVRAGTAPLAQPEPDAQPEPVAVEAPAVAQEPVEAHFAHPSATIEEPTAVVEEPTPSAFEPALPERPAAGAPIEEFTPAATAAASDAPELRAVVVPISRRPVAPEPQHPSSLSMLGVEEILRAAAARGASTMYLVAKSDPMVRADGEITPLDFGAPLSESDIDRMLLEVAPAAARDAWQRGAAAEWTFDLADVGRVRALTFTDHRGHGLIFRMIPPLAISADQLRLSPEVQRFCDESDGLVLVAGPRSSGKSTLLTAFVDLINRTRSDYVVTLESQIGFVHENKRSFISQRVVSGEHAAAGVRSALREDPDVLVIEDIRVAEVAMMALEAADTGRLVFASVPAASTVGAVERFLEFMPADRKSQAQATLAGVLRGVVSQVLLRRARGGRIAAREVLLTTSTAGSLIQQGQISQLARVIESGRRIGMAPLNDALVNVVRSGTVHVTEAYRKALDKDALLAALKRDGVDTTVVERLA